jgi:hypothetical protein
MFVFSKKVIVNKEKKPSTQELIAYVFSGLMMVVLGFWSSEVTDLPKTFCCIERCLLKKSEMY